MKQFIDERFRFVVRRLNDWGIYPGNDTNGADYCIMGVPDPLVIEAMIRKAPSQKTWIFMDFGSGNGAWGRTLAGYLERTFKESLEMDEKSFHILNLTGDGFVQETFRPANAVYGQDALKIDQRGCNVYEFARFPLEDVASELSSLRHKVDAIFSFATFRHLADPLGTYAQLFELLADNGFKKRNTKKIFQNWWMLPNP